VYLYVNDGRPFSRSGTRSVGYAPHVSISAAIGRTVYNADLFENPNDAAGPLKRSRKLRAAARNVHNRRPENSTGGRLHRLPRAGGPRPISARSRPDLIA